MLFMRHVPTQTAEISPPRPLRCAVYARVSVDDRQDSDMPSVEVQGQACRAYIEAHRHEHWQAIEPVYEDSGYSGGDLNRPALRQLLDDMQSDKIDIVLVHRLDRLSRSVQDLCALLPLFTIPGIRLVSMGKPLDTATPEGRLNLHLLTSFAQFERELIGERTREKLTATRANGLWQGNGAPLGYRVDHQQRLAVVDAEAGMVRDIFRRFLDFGSMGELVDFLQKRGYKALDVMEQQPELRAQLLGNAQFVRAGLAALAALPGIGPYTAAAVASIVALSAPAGTLMAPRVLPLTCSTSSISSCTSAASTTAGQAVSSRSPCAAA